MPNLYSIAAENPTSAEGIASLFWLEYIAEKRNAEKNLVDHDSFCTDVAKSEWRAYKTEFGRAGSDNFTYLCKVLPYFMGRTIDPQKRKKYMEIMKNRLVKEFVIEVDKEIRKLENDRKLETGAIPHTGRNYQIFCPAGRIALVSIKMPDGQSAKFSNSLM